MVGRGSMTDEHKMKIKVARDAYWARVRAEKAAQQTANPGAPAPLAPHIANSFNGPAQNPPLIVKDKNNSTSPKERTQHRVAKKLEKILDAQIDLATGLHYVTADGKRIYQKPPDGSTGQYLLNQLIGKPKESIEIKSTSINLDL